MGNQSIAPPLLSSQYLIININQNTFVPINNEIFIQGTITLNLIKQTECKDIELEIYCLEGYIFQNKEHFKSINKICKIPLNIKKQLNIKENYIFLKPDHYNFKRTSYI